MYFATEDLDSGMQFSLFSHFIADHHNAQCRLLAAANASGASKVSGHISD